MEQSLVVYESADGIATVTLNNPAKRNAGTVNMQHALEETITRAIDDSEVRVVIITGRGPAFMAGADLNVLATAEPLEYRQYTMVWRRLRQAMLGSGKPIIAAVNGFAFGAGAVLAWSSDLVVAAEEAQFGLQEILVGQFAAVSFLPRLIGRLQAAELILLGEPICAKRALELGLVNRVVPQQQLLPTCYTLAERLKGMVPRSIALAKQMLLWQGSMPEPVADLVEVELNTITYTDPEKHAATQDYLNQVFRKDT